MKRTTVLTSLCILPTIIAAHPTPVTLPTQNFNYACEFQNIAVCSRLAALQAEQAAVELLVQEERKKQEALKAGVIARGLTVISDHKPSNEEIEAYYNQGSILLIDNENYIFCDPLALEHKELIIELCRQAVATYNKNKGSV